MNGENYADDALKQHAIVFQQPILGNNFHIPTSEIFLITATTGLLGL